MAVRAVVVEADGGSRGNPGPAGYGAVVRDPETGEVLAERSESIGTATNNVAEYRGLIAGLEAAAELGAAEVEARMDSKLVVEQMCGRWQIKHPGLRPLAAQAAGLVGRFTAVRFTWIPRERNRHADALANAAMDAAASGAAPEAAAEAREAAVVRATGTDPATTPASWEPRPTEEATRLILVRHGETERTVRKHYSGRGDVPLTERGRAQARATAARVAALAPSVAAVVSSPLSRCTATAEAIAAQVGNPPVRTDDDLIECDFGVWEGRTFAEVRERWAAELDAWLASTRVAPPKGESFVTVAERTGRAVDRLRSAYPGETVVVVSHVSPIKLVLRDALAAGDAFLHRLYLDTAGISVLDLYPDGGVAVRSVNDTSHLTDV
ncbi:MULTISPECIES: bifunctional RNase H/acid phosphatase [unclassified Micromonospora]|uniref:bifunctional RNase H/acid phosphatase n=1 Tax=unclassified Micromonospora TaxID=2617518 RepID=UPI0003EEDEB3|nr:MULTISPECIES: bifunctional RNase H/acid phosphatase [unclassified Micromonospora]EWM68330.1 phosphoglycerate mutase [Micromonospora sp. M42]MCK1810029.1 bifunctional RNase H/acid phosphatase [Micromonospora sp. R42106]MCK1835126.1 bifunctional RNase H/acid phosphatase [Micromonospora sp. R42003]MCK1847073.1 bifunctional RNase H/acid phosphatase [Micromonospora sp. R42004]MCM1018365.1 bifunctional RNase H/acid phosphatase [Micromonospora sp. XM-20-01]